ncbi:hypothetical protein [Paludisphaera rhizosphaerae]|uniref:hypothetical protein n=1 Tax=Paludisphaera rhizosphaerae TaxID=2711216 RepID=UPI0013EB786E|nr:hypothetical protein [Paludisphaera rhizosphaerae]
MRRRILGPACLLAICAALHVGCEPLHSSTRKQTEPLKEEIISEADEAQGKATAVTSDGRPSTSPFFKNNRLHSGLSDQARDIEASLGVK